MKAILLRELKSYFITPLGYIYLALFFFISAVAFTILLASGDGDITYIYSLLSTAIMIIIPILTMRIFSEERRQKTEQLYLSAPVSLTSIVIGKYLSAFIIYVFSICITLIYGLLLSQFTTLNWAEIWGNFLGTIFLGSTCIAVTIFISSLTESQIISAIGSIILMAALLLMDVISNFIPFTFLKNMLHNISFSSHYYNLTIGILNFADLFFFISLSFIFIFLTIRILEGRRWNYNRASQAITILTICVIILFNIAIDSLTERYELFVDLTSSKLYEISQTTVKELQALDDAVSITVLADKGTMKSANQYTTQVYYTLLEYPRYSDKITLNFVNLIDNPTFVSQYPEYDLNTYDVIISSDKLTKVLPLNDMFTYNSSGLQNTISSSQAEQLITNGILYTASGKTSKIVVLEGFGDTSPDGLTSLIEKNNGTVISQSLITEEIDQEADIAILYDTRRDLPESALRKIDVWLDNSGNQGKTLMVFSNPYYTDLPNLNSYLAEWNLKLQDGLVVENNNQNYYSVFYCPIAQYADEDFCKDLVSETAPAIMMLSSPIQTLNNDSQYKTTPLLSFSSTASVLPLEAEDITEAEAISDISGVVLSSRAASEKTGKSSSIYLCGSCEFISSEILSDSTFSNKDFMNCSIENLGDTPPSVSIDAKSLATVSHNMPQTQMIAYIVLFLAVIPCLFLISGGVVWIKRKHS